MKTTLKTFPKGQGYFKNQYDRWKEAFEKELNEMFKETKATNVNRWKVIKEILGE